MHHYSKDNHYRWGWNGEWFNRPQAEGYFNISIGACTRPHETFREECINAATLLGKSFTKPILVGLSGGMDSQVVCLSLIKAQVPFQPVILKLYSEDGRVYNNFDIEGAHAFCEKFDLIPLEEELNLDRFWYEEAMQLVQDYCITVADIAVQLFLVKKYKDTHAYINGGGDPVVRTNVKEDDSGEIELTYALGPTPIEQYMIDHNIEGCLKFFMYTPELIASYLDNHIIHSYNAARYAIPPNKAYNHFTYVIKPMMYASEWPEMIVRKKNTGFEKYVFLNKVRMYVRMMNEHINPIAKNIRWSVNEMVEHLNSNTGEVKEWKSKDERDYY